MVFRMDRTAGLFYTGYIILGGFADPMFLPELISKEANMRDVLPGMETSSHVILYPRHFLVN